MRNGYLLLLLSTGFALTNCSGKDADPQPSNPIALNTAAVQVDGTAFPVVMENTVAVLNSRSGTLFVNIGAADVRGASVSFELKKFRQKAETFTLGATSGSNITVTGEYLNSPDGQYSTDRCSTNSRTFTITEFNTKAHTVSGTFSGTVCSTNGKRKTLSQGQFNLPYTVQ